MEPMASWEQELGRMLSRMEPHFKLEPSREQLAAYIRGLLADVERKNGREPAELAGDVAIASAALRAGRCGSSAGQR